MDMIYVQYNYLSYLSAIHIMVQLWLNSEYSPDTPLN